MTGSLSPTLPTVGQPNSTEDAKVKSSLETLRDGLNAVLNSDNTVMGMNTYRNIQTVSQDVCQALAAGTYLLGSMANAGENPRASAAEALNWTGLPIFYFDDADYLITGKTLKMRMRAQIGCNATKAALKFTFGLYPITVAGGPNLLKPTLGTVIAGSPLEINEPAASTVTQAVGSDFTIPADGAYLLGVVTSATLTTNSWVNLSAQLQVRNV